MKTNSTELYSKKHPIEDTSDSLDELVNELSLLSLNVHPISKVVFCNNTSSSRAKTYLDAVKGIKEPTTVVQYDIKDAVKLLANYTSSKKLITCDNKPSLSYVYITQSIFEYYLAQTNPNSCANTVSSNYDVIKQKILNAYFKVFDKALKDCLRFPLQNSSNIYNNFLKELTFIKGVIFRRRFNTFKYLIRDLQNFYLRYLFSEQKEYLKQKLAKNYSSRFAHFSSTLDKLHNDYRDEMRVIVEKFKGNISPESFKQILQKHLEKVRTELKLFSTLIFNNILLYLSDEVKVKDTDQLYLINGVCLGAVLATASSRINGNQNELVQPNNISRFLQAASKKCIGHAVKKSLRGRIGSNWKGIDKLHKEIKLNLNRKERLKLKIQKLLKNRRFRRMSVDTKCERLIKYLFDFSKFGNDFFLYRRIKGKIKVAGYTDEDYKYLRKELSNLNITTLQEDIYIEDQFLEKLKIVHEDVEDTDSSICSFMENFDRYFSKFNTAKSPHFSLTMRGDHSGSAHIIYLHLRSPYEIQDVNRPGFTIKTEDLHQFKMYLLFYFMYEAPSDYKHLKIEQILGR